MAVSIVALLVSSVQLCFALRLSEKQKMEYDFYLREYAVKVGKTPSWRQKIAAYNGALGGPAPKWHWLKPVLPPSDDAYQAT